MWHRAFLLTTLLLLPLLSLSGQSWEPGDAGQPPEETLPEVGEAEPTPEDADPRPEETVPEGEKPVRAPGEKDTDAAKADDEDIYLYVVEEITFEVDGWTNPDDVLAFLEFEKGAKFVSIEELTTALELFERDLYNERVFDEVEVTFTLLPGEELPREVAVHFYIDDGWTVLPIAFYRYNSNSGHNPFVVLYWDNFLGTLTDFGFSAGYYSRNWVDPYGWDVRVDLRGIRMLDRKWNIGFDQEFTTVEKSAPDGELLLRYTYYSTDFSVSTGFRLSDRWSYRISPGVGASYGYDKKRNRENDPVPNDAVAPSFSHGIGTGRADWYRNFRKGWNFGISNSYSFPVADRELRSDVSVASSYFTIFGILNPAVRAKLQHYFHGEELSKGGDIRGVSDSRVFGRTLFKLNSNVAIRVLDIPGFSEFNLVPFLDMAITKQESDSLDGDDLFLGGGADLVVFPHFLRGFQGRISVGVNLRDLPSSFSDFGSYEISITETLSF
jgi:hypothetical protein